MYFNYIDWVNVYLDCGKEPLFLDTLNDCAIDQLNMEPMRGKVTLNINLNGYPKPGA